MAGGGQAAQQHGRGRVQARRAGADLPKYISDAFDEHHQQLETGTADPHSEWYVKDAKQRYAVLEDRDEYLAANVFWVPKDARWTYLQGHAKQPTVGKLIDDAMVAIERDNPRLDAAKFVGELRHAC